MSDALLLNQSRSVEFNVGVPIVSQNQNIQNFEQKATLVIIEGAVFFLFRMQYPDGYVKTERM